jgi:hypothetical protein
MKSFKLFSIGCKIAFSSHISAFVYSVALLCNRKKPKSEIKILIFRFNQKSLNDFNKKSHTFQYGLLVLVKIYSLIKRFVVVEDPLETSIRKVPVFNDPT